MPSKRKPPPENGGPVGTARARGSWNAAGVVRGLDLVQELAAVHDLTLRLGGLSKGEGGGEGEEKRSGEDHASKRHGELLGDRAAGGTILAGWSGRAIRGSLLAD